MSGIIAIVGRPNVGKSTLFNRLTETRDAIVNETSGTTRDRHYGKGEWNGKEFSIIDTGGYVSNSDDLFESEINKQVQLAIDEADCIIFLVDNTTGVTAPDDAVAAILRRTKKKVVLVVNKVDNFDQIQDSNDFYSLGFGDPMCISSMSGSGTGDMLDLVTAEFEVEQEKEESLIPKIAIVGRPNVGKSSLINALIGEERNIVTPIAGTTRDSVHTHYRKFNHDFILIDTAGLRKKGKVHDDVEFYSVMRSIKAIESANICLLMIDATTGIESQDMQIFRLIETNKKGCIILVNKWDLVEKDNKTHDEWLEVVKKRIAPFDDVPILFISATTKQRVFNVLETVQAVNENMQKKITTSQLNEFLQEAMAHYPPPSLNGKQVTIKYATQLPTKIPSFAMFANHPQYIKEPYRRYLENQLREKYNFHGAPINIFFRQK